MYTEKEKPCKERDAQVDILGGSAARHMSQHRIPYEITLCMELYYRLLSPIYMHTQVTGLVPPILLEWPETPLLVDHSFSKR